MTKVSIQYIYMYIPDTHIIYMYIYIYFLNILGH